MKDQIFAYVKDKYGTVPEYPWKKYTGNAVLRHEDNNKWYGLIMPVDKVKLGLPGEGLIDGLPIYSFVNDNCDMTVVPTKPEIISEK